MFLLATMWYPISTSQIPSQLDKAMKSKRAYAPSISDRQPEQRLGALAPQTMQFFSSIIMKPVQAPVLSVLYLREEM